MAKLIVHLESPSEEADPRKTGEPLSFLNRPGLGGAAAAEEKANEEGSKREIMQKLFPKTEEQKAEDVRRAKLRIKELEKSSAASWA